MNLYDELWAKYRAKPNIPGYEYDDFLTSEIVRLRALNAKLVVACQRFLDRDQAEMEARRSSNLVVPRKPAVCQCGCCDEARAALAEAREPQSADAK